MKKEDLAWAAGFLQGDGSIGLYWILDKKSGNRYASAEISAFNTDLETLKKLQRILGGKIYIKAKAGTDEGRHRRLKDYYRWQTHRAAGHRIAKLVYPFMVGEKKKRLKEIIDYYEEKRSK